LADAAGATDAATDTDAEGAGSAGFADAATGADVDADAATGADTEAAAEADAEADAEGTDASGALLVERGGAQFASAVEMVRIVRAIANCFILAPIAEHDKSS